MNKLLKWSFAIDKKKIEKKLNIMGFVAFLP